MKRFLLPLCILALLVSATASKAATFRGADETRAIALINQVRSSHGLKPLHADPRLRAAARGHSQNMLSHGYFEHDGPDGAFGARLARYVNRSMIAENIAWGTGRYSTASGIVSTWMHSPGHRAIILMPGLRRIGLGIAHGGFQGNAGAAMATADFSS